MSALEWNADGDATVDGAWVIQTERGLHEPPYRSLMRAPIGFREWVRNTPFEAGWYCGPAAARRKVERLAAEFAKSREGS